MKKSPRDPNHKRFLGMSGLALRKDRASPARLLGRAYRPIVSDAENFAMLGGEEEVMGFGPAF